MLHFLKLCEGSDLQRFSRALVQEVSGFSRPEADVHDLLAVQDGKGSGRDRHVGHCPVVVDSHGETPGLK